MAISFSSWERKRAFIGESRSHMYTTTENRTTQCVSNMLRHVELIELTSEQTAEEEDDLIRVECVRSNVG